MNDVMVFTPVYRLEPETVEAVLDLEWDGPITWVFQEDNPIPSRPKFVEMKGEDRQAGVKNHLHQYIRGRELFLNSRCEALLVVESDIVPPTDALKRLAALDCDVAYGVYVFRKSQVANIFERYPGAARNTGESLSLHPRKWEAARRAGVVECSGGGLGCTLIKRHVLEQIDFRAATEEGKPSFVFCDSQFTEDVYRAGFSMMADTALFCGHVTEDGTVLWPS